MILCAAGAVIILLAGILIGVAIASGAGYSPTIQANVKPTVEGQSGVPTAEPEFVWSKVGDDKYHSTSDCSGMEGASRVLLALAENRKQTPCEVCMSDAAPAAELTAEPAATPTAEPIATPTVEPTATPTAEPTATPTAEPTATPTAEPTATPTVEPTATPTVEPTATPTAEPTATPTVEPTATPTAEPTATPTVEPTATPTVEPTATPTVEPAVTPTVEPSAGQPAAPAAPANPMNQGTSTEPEVTVESGRRPLVHADRVTEAMEQKALPLSGVKIGIDPGHQGKGNYEKEPVAPGSSEMKYKVSGGTQGVATRVPEYVVNLDVSLQLRDALEALGAEVYLTRDTHDIDISNIERATMMNELGVDLVLRIHCNGSENSSTKGISLFVRATGTGAEESYAASEALLPAMAEATGARAMGIYQRDTYSGLNWSEVPSILVEMGFMSNPEEDKLLNDPDYQQLLVNGMVRGIADYMGRALVEE